MNENELPDDVTAIEWCGGTRASTYQDWFVAQRASVADAGRRYDWVALIALLKQHPGHVNGWRLDGASWYAPLHQAASGGAPIEVVETLVELGAWRTLQTAAGERPIDIAIRKGHAHLFAALEPVFLRRVPPGVLLKVQANLHAVILGRVAELVSNEALRLPEIEHLLEVESPDAWFAVPGMYGGFRYALQERDGLHATVVTESWCRVEGGSGQRHEITARGHKLIAEGFV